MPKISVVIITFNEERNIERCLKSIIDVADEIVVVDSFSVDKTEELCNKYGVKFIQHPFVGHIEQKNYAITQASYPHILSLDADEELSSTLKKSILEVKENWTHDGYYFNRLTSYCGKWIRHTSWYPARKLRLWDSRKGRWGGTNPHDKFILKKGCNQKFIKGDLLHYSYYSIQDHIQQINRFTDIVARSYYQKGKNASYFNILFHPIWRLFRDYIIKLGFLDGFYGLVISVNSAHETFLKYIKLRNIIRTQDLSQRYKICFVNTTKTWGGGEKWHYDISTRICNSGKDVIFITNKRSELFFRIRRTCLKLYSIRVSNLSFISFFKIKKIVKILQREKVKTIIINLSADLKVAGFAAKMAGVQHIIYRRGSAIPIRNSILNRYIFKNIVTEIIANSEETKKTILTNNSQLFDPNKIKVIYNGINLKKFKGFSENGMIKRYGDEVIIGNAGRIVKQKGQKYFVDLAEILKRENLNFRIVIAGEGKLKNDIISYARVKKVEKQIEFIGFVENIRGFMEGIDIFCLPSLWEGFGYVLVEAMACYKPVVAFNTSSNPEIVTENETGYLVNRGDIEGMAKKIITLIKDKKLREQFGINGRKKVEEIFDIEKTMSNVEEFLEGKNGV